MIQSKINYAKNGPNDELYTPSIAVNMILPFIPSQVSRVWECTAVKESQIVKVLRNNGYSVVATHIEDGYDFLEFEPSDYDMIITNPPYSLKTKFLRRAFELGRPFMFLLPITTLEGVERNKMFMDNGLQLLIPNARFNYMPTKKSGAWFQTSWFTWRLGLNRDLNFIPIHDRVFEFPTNNDHIRLAA